MSELAEYAGRLHDNENKIYTRIFEPVACNSNTDKLIDIRVVVCDIYGTLINYWKPEFEFETVKTEFFLKNFSEIANRFGFMQVLQTMNPSEPPSKTLSEFYHGLIALNHEKAHKEGVDFPEIKIEEIWAIILMMLKRNGYSAIEHVPDIRGDISRYVAFTYNFFSLGRQLYPGVTDALTQLKKNNIALGILSNAQFYTPIDLTLLIRDQSKNSFEDYNELFDPDLVFYSYEYGFAKPSEVLFRKLYDALYEMQILPSQTLFIGNDLLLDIKPARDAGMKTALFTGDSKVAFNLEADDTVIPDITFNSWSELNNKVSFFEK